MEKKNGSWLQKELDNLSLGDQRLNKRLLAIANNLLAHHQMPINQACGDWLCPALLHQFIPIDKSMAYKHDKKISSG